MSMPKMDGNPGLDVALLGNPSRAKAESCGGGMIWPMLDQVLVKRTEAPPAGLVVVPDSAKKKSAQGEVLAVGPGKRNRHGERSPMSVSVGDRVAFLQYAGADVPTDESLVIMREDEILAVLDWAESLPRLPQLDRFDLQFGTRNLYG